MKGKNSLYNNLVPNSLEVLDSGERSQRNTYLNQRTDAMACRYYYHATICRLRYDDCLLHLAAEFFLEPDTIIGYLKKRQGYCNNLVTKQITALELRKKYPFFDWSGRIRTITKTDSPNLFNYQ
ncbi:hypothetical protein INR75_02870 [Zunongwangia sp. SCSIO 43204]|uniref:hypothetical protein n=1 Tax=Zunongwangia sp. SCSIO 43204 TaxID=2779359 RepID=UPI001CAA380A|nr:hypothetical protein [Zunongwangia sp. SCSIO 43204]UAB84989.1 hypothetical protein INR75_02870 [Zunongwangia sp. SCSIO 43204]